MGIVEDLLAQPGVYVGINRDLDADEPAAARIVITPLPGRAGVTIDYETFNPNNPDRVRAHAEHSVLAHTHAGGTILLVGHVHADSVVVLREREPGVFVLGAEGSPFPVEIKISMPEPGRCSTRGRTAHLATKPSSETSPN